MLFRRYVAEIGKNVNEIVAHRYSGQYMAVSFEDMLKPQEMRTGEQVRQHFKDKLGQLGA